jgi:hypothetical protein
LADLHARLPSGDYELSFWLELGALARDAGVEEGQIRNNWLRRWPRIAECLDLEEQLGVELLPMGVGFVVPGRRGRDKTERGRRASTVQLVERSEELIAAGMRPMAADEQTADEANVGRTSLDKDWVNVGTVTQYRQRLRADRTRGPRSTGDDSGRVWYLPGSGFVPEATDE